MNMALFKQMAGIDMLQVSYQGDAPQLVALLGGHVPMAFTNAVVSLQHVHSGKLRAIAVATIKRTPSLPDTPSIAESGLPGYESLLFYCLLAPAKTPTTVVDKLHEAATRIKQMPLVKQRFASLGAVPYDMQLASMRPYLQRELEKWTRVVKAGGIKPE